MQCKASLTIDASYYNDRLSNWEALVENMMQSEDAYRPWVLSLWLALEPGFIFQPPKQNERIGLIKFLVKDFDYASLLDDGRDGPIMQWIKHFAYYAI